MIGLGEGNTPLVPALSFKLEFINPTRIIQRELAPRCSSSPPTQPPPASSSGCAPSVPPSSASPASTVFAELEHWQQEYEVPLIVSAFRYCPIGRQGVEAIAVELAVALQHVFLPVGGSGRFARLGVRTRVHADQPTVVAAWQQGLTKATPVSSQACISGLAVTDEAIWAAQDRLLGEEDSFAKPALAGWLSATALGLIVCLVTARGAKNAASLEAAAAADLAAYCNHA